MPEATAITLRLPAAPDTARRVRRAFTELCDQLPRVLLDDASLLISEVVTNAVRHVGGMLTVRIECDDSAVEVEVTDDSRQLPVQRTPALDDDEGRGLVLLERIATAWQFRTQDGRPGKTIWFRIAA